MLDAIVVNGHCRANLQNVVKHMGEMPKELRRTKGIAKCARDGEARKRESQGG